MESVKSGTGLLAATALLAAGLTPAAASLEATGQPLPLVSAQVALAGNAVADSFDALAGFDLTAVAEELNLPGGADLLDLLPGDTNLYDLLPGAADAFDVPGAAAAFDFVGLFNAEVAAAVGLFNRFISLPFTLYNDVENLITSLLNLDFGMAFSQAVSIPLDIVNYVVGLPGAVIGTVFNMVLVLPGEYLFNFG
ncbi:hypothetical protein AWC02_08440 [Mycolicibacter engbaekii]|uniref:PE-PGRS family protein n=1 Tax=Mycolicibacter engbaekii TaxID=188915 RepID=A0A1X1TSK4_9MYCO|nr:hypothetical protein [Mycolicibacter engbaekii]ORV47503.1 hypothetical protein AWC02_08440 [Mycolicibacter engbaekii]